jgi:lipopolysaccharide export LptBFGC system permease protein LptF
MTVLLRLAVLVLLVYFVQSAVPKTERGQSHPEENTKDKRPATNVQNQTQQNTKRTDSKNIKKQTKRNNVHQKPVAQRRQQGLSKSSMKTRSLKAVPAIKTDNKQTEHSVSTREKTSRKNLSSEKSGAKKVISVAKASPQSKKSSKAMKIKEAVKKKALVVKEFPLSEIIFKGRASSKCM